MVSRIPSVYGDIARAGVISRVFATCGVNLSVGEVTTFWNPESIQAGDNVSIGKDAVLQAGGGLILGDDVLIGPRVMIWTQNHSMDDIEIPVRLQGYTYKAVEIGADCWIGANSFILPGVKLPRGCVVSAQSVVGIKAYREYSIIAGHPARVIGYRHDRATQNSSDGG